MGERTATRALAVRRALAWRLAPGHAAEPPAAPRRVLVAHNLLLGDTIMLSPLLAKLRAAHPEAEVTLLAQPAFVPLYAARPWGVRALPFTPRDAATTRALVEEEPFDLAVVAGDNRYSWLARAMRARHVVAHGGHASWTRDWCVDEHRPYRDSPAAWGDMAADLVDGPEPAPFARGDWAAPPARAFERPRGRYAVLHVGASTPLKFWPAERWRALAASLAAGGLEVVWSGGRGEEAIVAAVDPDQRYRSFCGRLDLAQLWHLLAQASLLVAPDTGVAHLGRATWTPSVTLFGPGDSTLAGAGRFWRHAPWRPLSAAAFPCRDQTLLFGRDIAWVRRCGRSTAECAEPRCIQEISVDDVLQAAATVMIR
jgi:ADP-heptose:LPS heptosyltransferase